MTPEGVQPRLHTLEEIKEPGAYILVELSTGNLVGAYDSLDEALKEVRESDLTGDAWDSTALVCASGAIPEVLASGRSLVAMSCLVRPLPVRESSSEHPV